MKAKHKLSVVAQVFTSAGYYGEPLRFDIPYPAFLAEGMAKAYDSLPAELEGQRKEDWTRTTFEVTREKINGD